MGLFDRFKKPAVNEDGQQVVKVTVDGLPTRNRSLG